MLFWLVVITLIIGIMVAPAIFMRITFCLAVVLCTLVLASVKERKVACRYDGITYAYVTSNDKCPKFNGSYNTKSYK